jgi:hypothetical protein
MDLEFLESRRHLSVTLRAGTLMIVGAGGDDFVRLSHPTNGTPSPDTTITQVEVNAQLYAFKSAAIRRIVINTFGGDDTIRLAPEPATDTCHPSLNVHPSDYVLPVRTFVRAGQGNDLIVGTLGPDQVLAGPGNDEVYGQSGDDVLVGNSGRDTLVGAAGRDRLAGLSGHDLLDGGIDDDTLRGHGGDDRLFGGSGVDLLSGSQGNDYLNGGKGSDTLAGSAGDDTLHVQSVSDVIERRDILSGGSGRDLLTFYTGYFPIDGSYQPPSEFRLPSNIEQWEWLGGLVLCV